MKKKILFVISFVLLFAISLFGCGVVNLKDGPDYKDTVYGNGGNAVVKGDYLYFSNAYVDYNTISQGENEYKANNPLKIYGIYRTKLNKQGVVSVNEQGFSQGAELLVPLASGFKNSGIYICDNYLYYTTVYTEFEANGNTDPTKGFLNFERVDLNGENRMELSKKGDFQIGCEYSINYIDGVTYITVLNNEKITVIKSRKGDISKYELASSVKEMAVASQRKNVYGQSVLNFNKYVYYTKMENEEYSLYRKPLTNGKEETLISLSSSEISGLEVKNNRVYFKHDNILKSSSFEENEMPVEYSKLSIVADSSSMGIVDYIALEDTLGYPLDRGVVFVLYTDSGYVLTYKNDNLLHSEKQINILFSVGNDVFYQIAEDNALYSVNLQTKTSKKVITEFTANINEEGDNYTFDFDSERVYFFAKSTKSNGKLNYLHLALLSNNVYKDDSYQSVAQYVGVLRADDVLAEDND